MPSTAMKKPPFRERFHLSNPGRKYAASRSAGGSGRGVGKAEARTHDDWGHESGRLIARGGTIGEMHLAN
jgi:hypothetical protein